MEKIIKKISEVGIVPVVVIDDSQDALELGKALIEGGLPCAEVTFRTSAAKEVIRKLSMEYPDMILGAGTVLNIPQVDEAIDAGAKFIVSPGLDKEVVTYCIERKIPVIPGVCTPSEIQQAIALGLEVVKFFPAEAAGGLKMLKGVAAPFPNIKFMPTGGISEENMMDYLSFSPIIACGGSWMVKREYITNKEFEKIKLQTKKAVEKMLGFEFSNICVDGQEEVAVSLEAGMETEIVKIPTNFIERAMFQLEGKGFDVVEETKEYLSDGKLVSVYLKDESRDLKIQLVQKGEKA